MGFCSCSPTDSHYHPIEIESKWSNCLMGTRVLINQCAYFLRIVFQMSLFHTFLICTVFESSASCALELVRGSNCFSENTAWIKGDCWPPFTEVVTRYPLCGGTKLNVFVKCVEGQSELIFGLIFPHKRYSSSLVHCISIILYYKALIATDHLVGGVVASWLISALDSGASGPGSSPGRGHCVVFLVKTLYSHCASLHPGI